MCISIQVTCKQFTTGFILLVLGLGTYLGHLAIQTNIKDINDTTSVQCVLLDSTPVNDADSVIYHNNWVYVYENRTYYHTDKTDRFPTNHMCCIDSANYYTVVDCVPDQVTEAILIIIVAWIVSWAILVCMWVDKKKYEQRRKSSIEMTSVGVSV